MKYNLIIKGGYGLTNFGDDALLYVLSLRLKPYFNAKDIAFACYENEYNELYTNGFDIIDVKDYKNIETDFLVYGGGTQFYNFKKAPPPFKVFLSKIKQFILNKNTYVKKNIIKKYQLIGAIGIGLGPFLNDNKQKKENNFKNECKEMSFLSVRDKFSKLKCQEWGINKFSHEADICYSMQNDTFSMGNKSAKIKNIGIVIRDWEHTKDEKSYYKKVDQVSLDLEKQGYTVTLILFATKSDRYWNSQKTKYKNVLEWKPAKMTIESFIEKLSEFELIITARYHGAVFSTLLGIPFISIVVEQKLSLISDIYDNCSLQWKFPFSVDECLQKVDDINKNYKFYCENIKFITEEQNNLSNKMFDSFLDFCTEHNLTKDDKK